MKDKILVVKRSKDKSECDYYAKTNSRLFQVSRGFNGESWRWSVSVIAQYHGGMWHAAHLEDFAGDRRGIGSISRFPHAHGTETTKRQCIAAIRQSFSLSLEVQHAPIFFS